MAPIFPVYFSFLKFVLTFACLLSSLGCSPSSPLARSFESGIWVPYILISDAIARRWNAVWRIHEPAWKPYDAGLFSWT